MDKNELLKMVSKLEDKVLVSRLLDKAEQCRYSSFAYTDFLSPYEAAIAKRILDKVNTVFYYLWGGYEGAERVTALLSCDSISKEDISQFDTLGYVRITSAGDKPLSHRDYLGSLLSLGLKREKIGDILVGDGYADVVVIDNMAEYICYNLENIGHTKVRCEILDAFQFSPPPKKEKLIASTVASLRADSVVSSGFGLSRTKILDYFKAQRVFVNWEAMQNPSKILSEGDVISVRGMGRIVLEKVGGTTKKDRISILIKRFE